MGIDAQMFARVKAGKELAPKEVKLLSWRICEGLGRDIFWVSREKEWRNHALEIIDVYTQDGDDIEPNGDQLIEVSLVSRYYGENYERGPLGDFIMIAEWLEANLPKGTEIWYGGDSSGVLATLFDKQARDKLFKHFARVGHQPYTGNFSLLSKDEAGRWCDFCEHSMSQYGFGGVNNEYMAFICYGCGLSEKSNDGGATWEEIKKGDSGF